jgi:hypothetical protein
MTKVGRKNDEELNALSGPRSEGFESKELLIIALQQELLLQIN